MPARICVLLLVLLSATLAHAAQAPAKAQPPADPAAEFTKLNTEFRALVAQLNQLRRRYQTDPNADKKSLEAEWQQKIEQVKQLELKLAVSAEQAFIAAPDKSTEETEFLFAFLSGLLQADDYEAASRLVGVLSQHGFKHKYFNLLAGLAFFGSMQFDEAKKYLTLAKQQNEIDTMGSRYLDQIDRHKYPELWQKEQVIRTTEEKANDLPKVKLTTNKGDIVILLLENEAPIATANFIDLVEKKFYDGIKFHRVIGGFMAQGGDPKGDGTGGPGYTIPDECYEDDHRNHFRGTLSMANTGERDTGGSQFFLTFLPTAHLDGKHTVFGRVIEGMDVLSKLQRCQPGDSATPDRIIKATVISKRNHPYVPVKRPDKT